MTAPTSDTQLAKKSAIDRPEPVKTTTPCPHCRSTARHSDRIGCCSLCGILYSSQSAFDKHIREGMHLPPADVGLVARELKADPSVPAWGMAGPGERPVSWRRQ